VASGSEIVLTQQQHSDLSSIAQSRALPAGYVFRAKLILMLAEGASFNAIKRQLQTTAPTIIRWKQRFRQSGIEGLDTYHPGQKPRVLTPALRARILSATRRKPSDGSTHWNCRKLAFALGVSKDAVHRVWQEAGLKPHRLERYMASVAFLQEVVSLCPPRQQIHIILDNLSAHKTQAVRDFLQQHPRVQFHFTPTYSSWLNQVEIWFAKIEREVIARGIFTSVSDLARKLRRYINAYSANARPIQWKYSDTSRRVRSNELTATGH